MFLRQVPQGQVALEQAVAFAPDNYWYSQGLVSLYQQQNELDKAAALLEKMVTRFPSKQDPLFSLLDIYSRQEKYNDVISTLNRLEKRLGKNEQLSMEKFRIYLQMKDDKKAFQEIESLVQEYPMDMRYQVILGDVYLQNGKKQEAYEIYKKVLAEEPDNAMAMYSLASYYEETGQKGLYEQQLDTLLLNKKVASDTKLNVMRQFIVQNEQAGKDSTRGTITFAVCPISSFQRNEQGGWTGSAPGSGDRPYQHSGSYDIAGGSCAPGGLQGNNEFVRSRCGVQSRYVGVLFLSGHCLQPGGTDG